MSVSSIGVARCPACRTRLSRIWMPPVPRATPGSYRASPRSYASVEDFATTDARRLFSAEVDFGLYWREAGSESTSRAAWIAETGELYVVKAGPPEDGGGHVEVLAVGDRPEIEAALAGWEAQCGRSCSLEWLRRRAARVSQRLSLSRPKG